MNRVPAVFRVLTLLALTLAAPLLRAADAPAAPAPREVDRAINAVYPALVRIFVITESARGGRLNKMAASGSGAIIREDGYIITNHHVAGRARRLFCRMPDGEEIEATLVGTDALADIAVLKLDLAKRRNPAPLVVAKFGDSDRVRVGDVVFAMGSPGGVSQSVTRGIVSNTALILPSGAFQLDGEDTGSLVRWIAHDAVIFGGNSGGPLVNEAGEIIGINEVGIANLSGAIPGNLARSVADQLIEKGRVDRSWTGLQLQPRPKGLAAERGVLVGGVLPDSPAAAAGLQPGDLLQAFDGIEVDARIPEDVPVANTVILSTPIGKRVQAKIRRDGRPLEKTLTTAPREIEFMPDRELRGWGLTGRDYTRLMALELQRPDTRGVFITTVQMGGPAAQAQPPLEPGDTIVDVGGKPVENLAGLIALTRTLTAEASARVPTLVTFDRGVSRYVTVARIGREDPPDAPEPARKPGFPVVLQAINAELARHLKLEGGQGARIAYVFPGRAADRAGFKAGDILLKLDGDPIAAPRPEDLNLLFSQIRQYRIGAEITFDLLRDGQPRTLTLKLEEDDRTALVIRNYTDDNFEMTIREMSETERILEKIPEDVKGVRIDRVEPGGWASLAHLGAGDILISADAAPLPDRDTAEAWFKEAAKRKPARVLFFIRRGVSTFFAELEPDWDALRNGEAKPAAGENP